jgi:anti-anti-sigma factor
MPEPAAPHPDPGPATTRPRPSLNGTAPPKPSVPPMPSEVAKAHTRAQRPAGGVFRTAMSPLRKMMPSPPPSVVFARVRAVRGRHGLPCATRPVPAHVIGSAVTQSAAPDASLSLTSRTERGGYVIAVLSGELGIASAPALREQLLGLLRRAASQLIIDLSAVERADASGLAVLVRTGRRAGLLGGSLRLAAPSPEVARVMSATGMNQHLDIFPTVRAAITG